MSNGNLPALYGGPIVGSLPEKMEVFKQMAANVAQALMLGGWDNAPKIMSGCWGADAVAVHPFTYMNGVHPANIGGRVVLVPKWEFENSLLRARLPGFDFEVVQNDEEACEIIFKATGRSPQRVRYTIAQAKQQGLAGKNPTLYGTNVVEGLWKQCFHRGADRIGSDVLMGLPRGYSSDEEELSATPGAHEPSAAEVIEEAAKPQRPEDAGAVTSVTAIPDRPAAPVRDWKAEMWDWIRDLYGKVKPEKALEAVRIAYKQMNAEAGIDLAATWKRGDEIGPVDAMNLVTFFARKYPDRKLGPDAGGSTDAAAREDAPASQAEANRRHEESLAKLDRDLEPDLNAMREPGADEDEPPPPSDADAPPAGQRARDLGQADALARRRTITALREAAKRAAKCMKGRDFLKEAPAGSGKWYFTDLGCLRVCGYEASVRLAMLGEAVGTSYTTVYDGTDQVAALLAAVETECTKAESGRK
jgi:hypothetical protein